MFKVQIGLSTPSDEDLNNLQMVVLGRQEEWSSLHLVLLVHNLSDQASTKKGRANQKFQNFGNSFSGWLKSLSAFAYTKNGERK